jgi:predicted hydrolase (HD superfamily)
MDVEETAEMMAVHGLRTVEMLREAGFEDEAVLQAIAAHNPANGSRVQTPWTERSSPAIRSRVW